MLKKKLVCALVGLGFGLGSFGAVASVVGPIVIGPIKNTCETQRDRCLAAGTNPLLCQLQYNYCLK